MMDWPADLTGWTRFLTFLPLVLCSVFGFALTLARWRSTKPLDETSDAGRAEFLALVKAGEYDRARALATDDAPLPVRFAARLLGHVGADREQLKDLAEHAGREAARRLEYGLKGLALIATLGPLFGLLGTVVGIILVFGQLTATGGLASPQQLAGGIGTALYTTVGGLLIGVFALVSHYVIAARADHLVAALETVARDVINLVCDEDRS